MSDLNSSLAAALLLRKVEEVGSRAGKLHSTLINAKSKTPPDFLLKYEELSDLVVSFRKNSPKIALNSNELVLADNIANYGLEIVAIINKYPLIKNPNAGGIKNLSEVSQDLKNFCQEILRWESFNWARNDAAIASGLVDEQDLQKTKTPAKMLEESRLELNAKLKKMQETVDAALLRAEVVTGQQADSIRESLTREVSNINEGFNSTNQALKERLTEFDGFREQAKKLLSEMAAEALAGGHIKSAKEEELIANEFREKALAAMKWGGGVIGLVLIIALFQNLSWVGIANRAMLVLLIVAPTAYLARESAKHRAQAVELRRASLDFAALEPFLRGIQGEEGLKVRAELARRAFFSGNPVDATSSYGLDPQALLTKLMDTLSDVSKAKN